MKIKLVLVSLFLIVSGKLFSQVDYGKSVVKVLASDKFAGRGYVFNGDKKAASFVTQEMKKSGLQPLGNSFEQPFDLAANIFPKTAKISMDNNPLKMGKDVLIDATSPSIKGTFDIVPAELPSADLADLKKMQTDAQFKNKIIFIDEANHIKKITAEGYRKSLAFLMTEGNYAAILVKTKQKFTWRGATLQNKIPVIYIQESVYDLLKQPHHITLDITAKFQPAYQSQNVCGFLKGTSNSDSTIVVTAHYDHIGSIGKKVIFNGANDNASGTAMMLYLANYYGKNKPKYNMIFLAFSGEESGLLGSKFYVNNPLNDLSKIKFLLNLDMAGTGDDGIQVVNGTEFKKEFELLQRINAEKGYLPKVLVRGPMNRSDHFPFYEKGVPCFFIYTLGGITAYHDIFDRYETLPFTKFNGYANLLIQFLSQL
jgi:aminopeptidase YwaD